MGQLLPILKPSDYRKDVKLFFKERLFDSSSSPVIAFGTDEGNRISYEGASSEEDYQNRLPILKKQALDNLKSIQPEIQVQDAQGTQIAFVINDEYASEKILDVEFMKSIGKRIGSNSLMVGIPFKGHLIATDANSDIRLKFPAIIEKYYNNPQQDPISDKVFLVNDGEIVAMAGENIDDDQNENFVITEIGKSNNYKVDVKSKSIEELTENVNTSFQQVMAMIMQRKTFGGEVAYHIGTDLKLDNQLVDKCQDFVKQIEENEMAQVLIQSLTNSSTKLTFHYKNKQIAPKTETITPEPTRANFSNHSQEELTTEFYKVMDIPNAQTNVFALTQMSALMKEFEKRGLQLPDPNSRPSDDSKKWWQFWK